MTDRDARPAGLGFEWSASRFIRAASTGNCWSDTLDGRGSSSSALPSATTAGSALSVRARRPGANGENMSKAPGRGQPSRLREMPPEYRLDYRESRPNRFAGRLGRDGFGVTLDPDVAAVFNTSEAVNALLRSVIAAVPTAATRKPGGKPRRRTG